MKSLLSVGSVLVTTAFICLSPVAIADVPGSLDTGFNPRADYDVNDVELQPNGKILIGGLFATVDDNARQGLARLNADGSVDVPFDANVDGNVAAVALQGDGKVVLGGYFLHVGGQARSRIARVNGDGSLDASFNPEVNGAVTEVGIQSNGKIILAGSFSTVGGELRSGLARLNADGTVDMSFNPSPDARLNFSIQSNDQIVLVGSFTTVGGRPRNGLARLNADGSLDSSFDPSIGGTAGRAAPAAGGKIWLVGSFDPVGGQPHGPLSRLNANGTVDGSLNTTLTQPNNAIFSIAPQDNGQVLVGGPFSEIGGQARGALARINSDGTLDTSFINPQINGFVNATATQPDGKIVVVGEFTEAGGQPHSHIARVFGGTVPPPTPAPSVKVLSVTSKVSKRSAYVTSRVQVSGAGRIAQSATTGKKKLATWCRTSAATSAAGIRALRCKLTSKGRKALRKQSLKLTLRTAFTPSGGAPVSSTRSILIKRKR